jgi:hypothetical protein
LYILPVFDKTLNRNIQGELAVFEIRHHRFLGAVTVERMLLLAIVMGLW